jgi:signal transduction histidine kinase
MSYKKSLLQRLRISLHSSSQSDLKISEQYKLERLGLAQRLHDTLAQDLAVIGYQLDGLLTQENLSPSLRDEIRDIRIKLIAIARGFRQEIYQLRSTDRLALQSQLQETLAFLDTKLDFSYPLFTRHIEDKLNSVLMEIARNTVKHAKARSFYLTYQSTPESIEILIGDDGIGHNSIKTHGFGLLAIDEILKEISDGYLCSSNSSGTHFQIRVNRKHLE